MKKSYFIFILSALLFVFIIAENSFGQEIKLYNNVNYTLSNLPFPVPGFPWAVTFTQTLPTDGSRRSLFYEVELTQNRETFKDSQDAIIGTQLNFRLRTYRITKTTGTSASGPRIIYTKYTYGNYYDGNLIFNPPYSEFEVGHGTYYFLTATGFRTINFKLFVPAS
jgi:hypothetical protein